MKGISNIIASHVDSDEMAHNEPSHLDLHCLHRFLVWSAVMKGFESQNDLLATRVAITSELNVFPYRMPEIKPHCQEMYLRMGA